MQLAVYVQITVSWRSMTQDSLDKHTTLSAPGKSICLSLITQPIKADY